MESEKVLDNSIKGNNFYVNTSMSLQTTLDSGDDNDFDDSNFNRITDAA
jgi:hypothetical protein